MGISIIPLSARDVPVLKVKVMIVPDLLNVHPATTGNAPITGVTAIFPFSAEIAVEITTGV